MLIFIKKNPKKPSPTVHQCEGRGQCSNFSEVELNLLEAKTDPLFLSEMGINNSIPIKELAILGYSPLITKDNHLNCHGHRLGTYINERFPSGRDTKYEDPDLLYMSFRMALNHSSTFIFTLFCPQDDGMLIFDQISSLNFHHLAFISVVTSLFTTKSG